MDHRSHFQVMGRYHAHDLAGITTRVHDQGPAGPGITNDAAVAPERPYRERFYDYLGHDSGVIDWPMRLCYYGNRSRVLPEKAMLKKILFRLIAICYIAFIFLTSTLFFLIAVVISLATRPFDKRLRLLHRFTCFWASLYIWVFPPWSVTIHGREKIDDSKTYIIVSNHQSLVDILVAFTLFTHFKWVSKAELFSIPLIGWNMFLNQYVRLERGSSASVRKMYRACEDHLQQGSSIFLFPEGTRSASGQMREFKEGAFVLAKRMQLPILPLVIDGSRNAVPKNSLNFHGRSDIHVTVLDEIPPQHFANTTVVDLSREVQQLIQNKLTPVPSEG
ncbi:MAG: lysophospholipid acyltransferase family protein [Proteobacteria bacterium]|nr:lysophospholipid acyltransferase family protein [Pseudomonadota bacterium]MDA1299588.1 lysophospholipid acyltransferase family protein [Pseudomonadota bacterium]